MKRIVAVLGAAALLAAMPGTAGHASPGTVADAARTAQDCIPMDGTCLSFDAITEDTNVYAVETKSGGLRGFSDFNSFASFVGTEYNVTVTRDGDGLGISDEPPNTGGGCEGDDCPDTGGGSRHLFSARVQSDVTVFYDSALFVGSSFALDPPNSVNNLSSLPAPGGGTWNNRISSVRTEGGSPLTLGARLCAKVGCATGWKLFIKNHQDLQLLGGLSNTASSVRVF